MNYDNNKSEHDAVIGMGTVQDVIDYLRTVDGVLDAYEIDGEEWKGYEMELNK